MLGKIYVIGTPIGNLSDISFRAIEMLKMVDVVFCEDTRVTRKLLSHYGIKTKCFAYHTHSNEKIILKAADMISSGMNVALVSDAGTPAISDPGVKFVRGVTNAVGDPDVVRVIPGASAVVSALSASGAPSSSFTFLGFPPHKKGRMTFFKNIAENKETIVFYESPHRLIKALTSLCEYLPKTREVIVAREMTKIYESFVRGNAEEVLGYFTENKDKVRGEIVIIVSSLS